MELEREQVIVRIVYPVVLAKIEYKLTEYGKTYMSDRIKS